MVAVRVRVHDEQPDTFTLFARQPFRNEFFRNRGRVACAGSGINQQGSLTAEDQIEKRLFVVRTAALPKDVEVWIVFMNLPVRELQAIRSARDPGRRKTALFDAGCGGEQGSGKDE